MITILIIYAALITLLYICSLFGAAADRQDSILSLKHDRIAITDLIQQLSETKTALADLDLENANLKQVIARQDKDLTTCHKLMKQYVDGESRRLNPQTNKSPSVDATSCRMNSVDATSCRIQTLNPTTLKHQIKE
jgi:hypothetical protein